MFVVLGASAGMVLGWHGVAWEMRMARGAGNEMRGGDCQDRMGGLCRSAMCLKQEAEMGPCRMGEAGTGTGGIQTAYGTENSAGAHLAQDDHLSRPSRVPPFLC